MKRFLLLLTVLAVAVPAFSFDPARHKGAIRITILQAPVYEGDYGDRVAARVRRQLAAELRERGFDAVEGRVSYDELRRSGRSDSDFYVEISPDAEYARPVGGAAVNVPNATIDFAVVVSRAAAELHIYDGRTFDLIARRRLDRRSTTVVPTGVGVGTYRMSVWFALPLVEYVRYRTTVNAVVEDAAKEIVTVSR